MIVKALKHCKRLSLNSNLPRNWAKTHQVSFFFSDSHLCVCVCVWQRSFTATKKSPLVKPWMKPKATFYCRTTESLQPSTLCVKDNVKIVNQFVRNFFWAFSALAFSLFFSHFSQLYLRISTANELSHTKSKHSSSAKRLFECLHSFPPRSFFSFFIFFLFPFSYSMVSSAKLKWTRSSLYPADKIHSVKKKLQGSPGLRWDCKMENEKEKEERREMVEERKWCKKKRTNKREWEVNLHKPTFSSPFLSPSLLLPLSPCPYSGCYPRRNV